MRPKVTLGVSGPSLRRSIQSAGARTRSNTGRPASAVDRPSCAPEVAIDAEAAGIAGAAVGHQFGHQFPRIR